MKYDTDIVIVGSGPSGLAAAITAAEGGAEVILLEKSSTTGGAANMGMGPFAAGTYIQRKEKVGLTADEAYDIFMNYTHFRTDARLVRRYIDKSADTIEWLQEMGVQFAGVMKYFPGSEASWHVVRPVSGPPGPRCASAMLQCMTERAEELGVQILYETPAKQILKEDGYVCGVLATAPGGEETEISCGAVIIATGGFGDNPEMVEELLGFQLGVDMFSHRIPGLVGDGIRMAWEAGAARSEMNMEITGKVHGLHESMMSDQLFRQPSVLCVDYLGERVFNEEVMENTTFLGNAVARLKKRSAFAIIDTNVLNKWKKQHIDLPGPGPDLDIDQALGVFLQLIDDGLDTVFAADSLEELAEKTGINGTTLKATVEEYNCCCDDGFDSVLGKDRRYLTKLDGPHFYAARFNPSAYGSLGGIKINYKTEVIDEEWNPIPGLYAAGTDACSIFGDSYVFILPGNTMGFSLNSGRLAGEAAIDYIFLEEEEQL